MASANRLPLSARLKSLATLTGTLTRFANLGSCAAAAIILAWAGEVEGMVIRLVLGNVIHWVEQMGFCLDLSFALHNLGLFCIFLASGHSQTIGAAILLRLRLELSKDVRYSCR